MERSQQKVWQNAINPQLKQRLIRPLNQPRVINFDMATKVLLRSQQFNHPNPLIKNPRWSIKKNLDTNKTPIVYAQPSLSNQAENSSTVSPDTSGKSPSSPVQTNAEKINSVSPIRSSISQPIIQRKIDAVSSSNVPSLSNTDDRDRGGLPLAELESNHPESVISQSSNQRDKSPTANFSELPLVKPELTHPESVISHPSDQENARQGNGNQRDEPPTANSSELPLVKPKLTHPESIISQPSHQGNGNQRDEPPTPHPSGLPLTTVGMSTVEQQRESTDKSNLLIIYPHKITHIALSQINYREKQLQFNRVSSNNQQNNATPLVKLQNNVNHYSLSSAQEPFVVSDTPKQQPQPQQNLTPLVHPQANSQRPSESIVDPNFYQQIQQHNRLFRLNYAELRSRCQHIRQRNRKLSKFLKP